LHFDDIQKLLTAFRKLLDGGASILVIEHNLEMIKSADWIIDLGPEGGAGGGQIVATGTPEQVARNGASHTGRFLAKALQASRNNGKNGKSQKNGSPP
jgi:excinuclease ABC subunit A